MSFVPPVPRQPTVPAFQVTEPPNVQPILYLPSAPAALTRHTAPSPLTSKTAEVWEQGERHFQRGKKYYQAKDIASARREFDAAIDRMLEAGQETSDRQRYEKRFEEMVEADSSLRSFRIGKRSSGGGSGV